MITLSIIHINDRTEGLLPVKLQLNFSGTEADKRAFNLLSWLVPDLDLDRARFTLSLPITFSTTSATNAPLYQLSIPAEQAALRKFLPALENVTVTPNDQDAQAGFSLSKTEIEATHLQNNGKLGSDHSKIGFTVTLTNPSKPNDPVKVKIATKNIQNRQGFRFIQSTDENGRPYEAVKWDGVPLGATSDEKMARLRALAGVKIESCLGALIAALNLPTDTPAEKKIQAETIRGILSHVNFPAIDPKTYIPIESEAVYEARKKKFEASMQKKGYAIFCTQEDHLNSNNNQNLSLIYPQKSNNDYAIVPRRFKEKREALFFRGGYREIGIRNRAVKAIDLISTHMRYEAWIGAAFQSTVNTLKKYLEKGTIIAGDFNLPSDKLLPFLAAFPARQYDILLQPTRRAFTVGTGDIQGHTKNPTFDVVIAKRQPGRELTADNPEQNRGTMLNTYRETLLSDTNIERTLLSAFAATYRGRNQRNYDNLQDLLNYIRPALVNPAKPRLARFRFFVIRPRGTESLKTLARVMGVAPETMAKSLSVDEIKRHYRTFVNNGMTINQTLTGVVRQRHR